MQGGKTPLEIAKRRNAFGFYAELEHILELGDSLEKDRPKLTCFQS